MQRYGLFHVDIFRESLARTVLVRAELLISVGIQGSLLIVTQVLDAVSQVFDGLFEPIKLCIRVLLFQGLIEFLVTLISHVTDFTFYASDVFSVTCTSA